MEIKALMNVLIGVMDRLNQANRLKGPKCQ